MILMDGEDERKEKKRTGPLTNLNSEKTCTGLAVRARHHRVNDVRDKHTLGV